MVFRVEISPEALADLDAIAPYIRERGSCEGAGLRARRAVVQRDRRFGHWLNCQHAVRVFHVRHWAMKPAEAEELRDLMAEPNEADAIEPGR